MSTKAAIPFLIGMMLLTGVCNTLLTKYQDMQCVRNCDDPNPDNRKYYEQPVWQTAQMFVGEMGCWLVVAGSAIYNRLRARTTSNGYEPVAAQNQVVDGTEEDETSDVVGNRVKGVDEEGRRPLRGWRVILLALPAGCDIAGTTLMNVGLLFVAASIYQMTRGALILFVGAFSVIFLGRRLVAYKWFALIVSFLGVLVVGLAGIVERRGVAILPGPENPPPQSLSFDSVSSSLLFVRDVNADTKPSPAVQVFIGIMLIFGAQVFTASQFVIEEAIMKRFSLSPLNVVGWEGTFGLTITLLIQLIMHAAYGQTEKGSGGYFDARTGWHQIMTNRAIGISALLIMVSIGGFNFFGLSVTRNVSATSRSLVDTCRTLFIWAVSLGLRWETFKWLQVLGFAGLVYGTFLFNDLVRPPRCGRRRIEVAPIQEQPVLTDDQVHIAA